MSKIKIKPENNVSVPIFVITDSKHQSQMEVWAYKDSVLFAVDSVFIKMSPPQMKKLNAFIIKQARKDK